MSLSRMNSAARKTQQREKLLLCGKIWLQAQPVDGVTPPLTSISSGSALHKVSRSSSACGCCPSAANASARHSRRELESGAGKKNAITHVMSPWEAEGPDEAGEMPLPWDRPCATASCPAQTAPVLLIWSLVSLCKQLTSFCFSPPPPNALSAGSPPLPWGSVILLGCGKNSHRRLCDVGRATRTCY